MQWGTQSKILQAKKLNSPRRKSCFHNTNFSEYHLFSKVYIKKLGQKFGKNPPTFSDLVKNGSLSLENKHINITHPNQSGVKRTSQKGHQQKIHANCLKNQKISKNEKTLQQGRLKEFPKNRKLCRPVSYARCEETITTSNHFAPLETDDQTIHHINNEMLAGHSIPIKAKSANRKNIPLKREI